MTPEQRFEAWLRPFYQKLSESEKADTNIQHLHVAWLAGYAQGQAALKKYACHIQSGCMKEVYGYECGCGLAEALRTLPAEAGGGTPE